MGRAEGQGEGEGRCGGDSGGNVAAGASWAVCCISLFCTCGMPLLLAGSILIAIKYATNVGIALVCVASGLTIIALVLIVLTCSGVLKKKRTAPEAGTVINQTNVISNISSQTVYGNQRVLPPSYSEYSNPPPYDLQLAEPGQSTSVPQHYTEPNKPVLAYPPPTAPPTY